MKFRPEFLMSVFDSVSSFEKEDMGMTIVIQRPYTHLERELRETFKESEDVRIIVDNRYEDRRLQTKTISDERREKNRRREKVKMVEVVLST